MLNGRATVILLTLGLIKKIFLYKMNYFPDSHTHSKNETAVDWDLSNYATKSDLKNATGINTSDFAKKIDLAYIKCC